MLTDKKRNLKRILLVDTNHLLYRLYFSTRNIKLTSPYNRERTTLLFIFLRVISKLIREKAYHNIIFCFDSPSKTLRYKLFSEYKIHRPSMPADMIIQIPLILNLLTTLSFPWIHIHTLEADDIIATFAEILKKKYLIHILSNDRDFIQLIDKHVSLIVKEKENIPYREINVENVDIHPDQFIDYRSLVGDKSDNIPGVKGIGKIQAFKLLTQYKNIDNIVNSISSLPPRLRKILNNETELSNMYLSRNLTKLDRFIPLYCPLKIPKFNHANFSLKNRKLENFLNKYQIRKINLLQQ